MTLVVAAGRPASGVLRKLDITGPGRGRDAVCIQAVSVAGEWGVVLTRAGPPPSPPFSPVALVSDQRPARRHSQAAGPAVRRAQPAEAQAEAVEPAEFGNEMDRDRLDRGHSRTLPWPA